MPCHVLTEEELAHAADNPSFEPKTDPLAALPQLPPRVPAPLRPVDDCELQQTLPEPRSPRESAETASRRPRKRTWGAASPPAPGRVRLLFPRRFNWQQMECLRLEGWQSGAIPVYAARSY